MSNKGDWALQGRIAQGRREKWGESLGKSLLRLILMLFVAGVVSLLAGLAFGQIAALLHCEGEGLACNIDQAVGAYAVTIIAVLGPIIFAVTLLIAQNRTALAGAAIVLLTPLLAVFGMSMGEAWRYVGFYPYKDLRTFLVMLAPPVLTVLVQWLVLHLAVPSAGSPSLRRRNTPGDARPPDAEPKPHAEILFPTE